MKPRCPDPSCVLPVQAFKSAPPPRSALRFPNTPKSVRSQVVFKGYFFRKSDSHWVRRYLCRNCGQSFSSSTRSWSRNQKARRITPELYRLVCSGVSQRRAAIILGVNRKTVVRRFRYLAYVARRNHWEYLTRLDPHAISELQLDDLETSEHTKCKPLSVALAVEPKTRKILSFAVSSMPAKGHLAKLSVRKYGHRKDERARGWDTLLESIRPLVKECVTVTSDENPHYPRHLKKQLPKHRQIQIPGGRGAVSGQGELKKKRFDPMFSLNHTCAMLRANLNRLFRKTWCTTKTKLGLENHLAIYVDFHNRYLTPPYPPLGAS